MQQQHPASSFDHITCNVRHDRLLLISLMLLMMMTGMLTTVRMMLMLMLMMGIQTGMS